MEGRVRRLDRDAVRGILQRGGTILGTSRRDPYVHGEGAASLRETLAREWIDALVVVGGDGTLRTRAPPRRGGDPDRRRAEDDRQRHRRAPTSRSASTPRCRSPTEAIDRITTTAESHDRVMVVEVMGRTRGWIATYAGIAGGRRRDPRPGGAVRPRGGRRPAARRGPRAGAGTRSWSSRRASSRRRARRSAAPLDAFGFERLGGVSAVIAPGSSSMTGFEARVTVLGHIQRGGTPSAARPRPRVAPRRRRRRPRRPGTFGRMVALRGTDVVRRAARGRPRRAPRACRRRSSTSPGRSRRDLGSPGRRPSRASPGAQPISSASVGA